MKKLFVIFLVFSLNILAENLLVRGQQCDPYDQDKPQCEDGLECKAESQGVFKCRKK